MSQSGKFGENRIRPIHFLASNPVSLMGVGLTIASALTLICFWVADAFGHGGPSNPYVGIIIDVCLPMAFVVGLILIPIGISWRSRQLEAASDELPIVYHKFELGSRVFRRALIFLVLATLLNFAILGAASYRGVAYMDKPSFCGQSCHVMAPEWNAYHVSPHAKVPCTDCHIAEGVPAFVHAKLNGTRQLLHVVFHNNPRPIMPESKVPPASATCLKCHNPELDVGDKLVAKASFDDDEKNSVKHSLVLVHVGGKNMSGHMSGIHGAHLGRIEYVATDGAKQTIPWFASVNRDRVATEYVASDVKAPASSQRRVMDCIDCHNRPAHSFETPEGAVNRAMAQGRLSVSLPFVHKEGLALIKAQYASEQDARGKIENGLAEFYRARYPDIWSQKRTEVDQAVKTLNEIYERNVSPSMEVTWGTHPNNVGHNDYPGCFRCHDGNHQTKNGTALTNDCTTCHNLLAVDEAKPSNSLIWDCSKRGIDCELVGPD
jgi:nitrate/TMAO reductase-like tetraheme cytochrome c subunit